MCNRPCLHPSSSFHGRILYTSLLKLNVNGCPSGLQLLKDLEICEHNTFYNYKFVDKWAKSHKTYSWWYRLGISWDIAQLLVARNNRHSISLHCVKKNVETKDNNHFDNTNVQGIWLLWSPIQTHFLCYWSTTCTKHDHHIFYPYLAIVRNVSKDEAHEKTQIKCHQWILWEDNSQTQLWWHHSQGISIQRKRAGSETLPLANWQHWWKELLVALLGAEATLWQVENSHIEGQPHQEGMGCFHQKNHKGR